MAVRRIVEIETLQDMTERHVSLGWQCPECYGVRITTLSRRPHDPHRFLCQECGAQWTRTPNQE